MLPFLIPLIVTGLKVATVATAATAAYAAANNITSNIIKWARASIAKIKELMRSRNSDKATILKCRKTENYNTINLGLRNEEICVEAEDVDSNIYEGLVIRL